MIRHLTPRYFDPINQHIRIRVLKKYRQTDTILLGIILLAGTVLRFYNYFDLPFSYDEFSALFRTRFDNFSDLIHYGVITTDTHPAGVQVFMYYWVMLFGEAAWIVKLPFVLAGIGAIYLTYRVATAWFNSSVGLLSAMMISFLQFTITYSQFARPYASGLFFCLLLVWSLHNAFFRPSEKNRYHVVMYVFAGAACAYNHHFSLFFLGLAGISGLFVVPKNGIWKYILINLLIFILYIPHLSIFFAQLNKGGVESWLKKPDPSFFGSFVHYLLHHSVLMVGAVVLLILISLAYVKKTIVSGNKFRLIMFVWVAITLITAYYYSLFRSAVLQYSVLIFIFPFLVMLVFSFAGNFKSWLKYLIVFAFGTLSIYTLIVDRQHYRIQYQSVLEQTMARTARARGTYGEERVASATNISTKVQDYYAEKYSLETNHMITFDSTTHLNKFREELESLQAEYLAIGWVNISDLEYFAVAREIFPLVVEKENYYTGDFYLLSRNRNGAGHLFIEDRVTAIRVDSLTLYNEGIERGYPMLFDHNRVLMPGWLGYSIFYEKPLREVVRNKYNYLWARIEVENPQPDFESILIVEILRNDEVIYWNSRAFSEYTISDYGRYRIHITMKLNDLDFTYTDEQVKIYLSNLDNQYYYLNYFKLNILEGNPLLYSLFEKIQE